MCNSNLYRFPCRVVGLIGIRSEKVNNSVLNFCDIVTKEGRNGYSCHVSEIAGLCLFAKGTCSTAAKEMRYTSEEFWFQ